MRSFLLFSLFISLTTTAFSKSCYYSQNAKSSSMKWTAYKTLKKIGVSGTFNQLKFTSFKSTSIQNLLETASFLINAESVETKNAARDVTIAKFFFSTMKGGAYLKGHIATVKKDKLKMILTMNGITKEVSANYHFKKNQILIKSQIDVLDFAMHSEHIALGKACSSKHEGKTWSTVDLEANISINVNCN